HNIAFVDSIACHHLRISFVYTIHIAHIQLRSYHVSDCQCHVYVGSGLGSASLSYPISVLVSHSTVFLSGLRFSPSLYRVSLCPLISFYIISSYAWFVSVR